MGSLCYKGVAGAVKSVTAKSCKIFMPCSEDWEVSARIAFQLNEDAYDYVGLPGLACRSFEQEALP